MTDNLEDTDFDDILDHWQKKKKHGYRWEGETGVSNFENLTKDIGYGQGIEEFLADNPGAVEKLLEFILEHAENGGSEWKTNLAKACDYEPDEEIEIASSPTLIWPVEGSCDSEPDDEVLYLKEFINDGTKWVCIGKHSLQTQEEGEEIAKRFMKTWSKFVITKNNDIIKEFLPKE